MKVAVIADKEKYLEALSCFLIVSAQGLIREPAHYGPIRLLEAASRLLNLLKESHAEYSAIQEKIDEIKIDPASNEDALDKIVISLTKLYMSD
jgi:hypothetical protein